MAQPATHLAQSPPGGGFHETPVRFACRMTDRAEVYLRNWQAAPPADINRAWRAFTEAHTLSEAAWDAVFGRA